MSKLYTCKHPDCNVKQPILSKGLCNYHREQQRISLGEETMLTKKSPLKKISNKRKNKLRDKQVRLEPFFKYHISKIERNPYCQNCGCKITNPYRWSVAHILPKNKYKDVMNHLDNAVYLCVFGNGCHQKFDKIQVNESVYEMNVWREVISKYNKFKKHVSTEGIEKSILDKFN